MTRVWAANAGETTTAATVSRVVVYPLWLVAEERWYRWAWDQERWELLPRQPLEEAGC